MRIQKKTELTISTNYILDVFLIERVNIACGLEMVLHRIPPFTFVLLLVGFGFQILFVEKVFEFFNRVTHLLFANVINRLI